MKERSNYHELRKCHGLDDLYPMNVKNKEIADHLCSLVETQRWNQASTEREQVIIAHEFCHDFGFDVSQYELARFFGIERSTVQYHIRQGLTNAGSPIKSIGRPPILTEYERTMLIDWITLTYEQKYPATYQLISDFLNDKFGKDIRLDTIRHLVSTMEELKVVVGKPMENDRVFCQSEKIDKYFDELEAALEFDIPPEFIINIDESGYQEWVDARDIHCIVPSCHPGVNIKVPKDRSTKRATMLCGICADGSTIRPMIVLTRETIERELLDHGYTPNKVLFGKSDTGFMNQELFLYWARESFIPEMRERRARCQYDGPILLLMDGFGVHDCDKFRELLSEENIHALLFAPHSSDQTQFLDLLIFGVQKGEMQRISLRQDLNPQSRQVIKILDAWWRSTVPRNVIGSFRRGGLLVRWSTEKNRLIAFVDRSHARSVRHFVSITEEDSFSKERIRI